eukprot:scaffold132363_cov19-Tisochrysis_lutea.AAC.4
MARSYVCGREEKKRDHTSVRNCGSSTAGRKSYALVTSCCCTSLYMCYQVSVYSARIVVIALPYSQDVAAGCLQVPHHFFVHWLLRIKESGHFGGCLSAKACTALLLVYFCNTPDDIRLDCMQNAPAGIRLQRSC